MRRILIPFIQISILYLIVGFILRMILLFSTVQEVDISFLEFFEIFLLGIVNDLCVIILGFFFFLLHLLFLSDTKYSSPWRYIILSIFILLTIYLFCFKTIINDYGSVVLIIVKSFLVLKFVTFLLLSYFPGIRKNLRYVVYCILFFLYVFMTIFSAISEFLFWEEFKARYNFIAIDYLIHTNEIAVDIIEAYPIIPMFSILFLLSLVVTMFFVKKAKGKITNFPRLQVKLGILFGYLVLIIGSVFLLKATKTLDNSDNIYVEELQANGIDKLYIAYRSSSIDYNRFYAALPIDSAFSIINKKDSSSSYNPIMIRDSLPELRKNVVLVTVESMSADFLKYFGNSEELTPNLDRLAEGGMFFTNLYATGDRTMQGLEALTLGLPPSAGGDLVKKINNDNYFSTGYLFNKRNYIVQYFYGGYSYFDNMESFFRGNYQIIDRSTLMPNEVTFANIRGVCDENIFEKAIQTFDENVKTSRPFFAHIMTLSNQKPFTYPEGKINIPSSKLREGGVKYTDYAIGNFIEEAKKHSWFSNTVFIFVADHGAPSIGKANLSLKRYQIPAIIYSPGFIMPEKIKELTSQIDVMPTVLGKLHFSYTSYFYGKDVKDPGYTPRAFFATYQKLGFLKNDILTVLSPNKIIEQYKIINKKEVKIEDKNMNKELMDEAIANYQTASYLADKELLKINSEE